ncbi:MAG: phosphoenolpyruvate carboxylase [Alphaproteobacteria bacterium]
MAENNRLVNPIIANALDHFDQWEKLSAGDIPHHIAPTLNHARKRAIGLRASSLASYIGDLDQDQNDQTIRALFERCLYEPQAKSDKSQKKHDFKRFADNFDHCRFGMVFTAHPTFAIKDQWMQQIAALAAGEDSSGLPLSLEARDQMLDHMASKAQQPETPITLDAEFEQAEQAILYARNALKRALAILIDLCAAHYPEQVHQFCPILMDIASWVGLDMDGRTDIGWTSSVGFRLQANANFLTMMAQDFQGLASWPSAKPIASNIAGLARQLKTEADLKHRQTAQFVNFDAKSGIDQPKAQDYVDPDQLQSAIDTLIDQADNRELKNALLVQKAMLRAMGLSSAKLHVRLNAIQVHNSVRHLIELEGEPTDPALQRIATRNLLKLFDQLQPRHVGFNEIAREQSSGRRLFMLVQHFLEMADCKTPIRILIAECDGAFTVLAALYLAKRYGIEEKVDISPLFETPDALEHGATIIETLLGHQAFMEYITKRGTIAVQTGFSDAGRHLGQAAAGLAVERFHIKLAAILKAKGLAHIQVILFNTHGESIGRGAHPLGMKTRLRYILSPYARNEFHQNGNKIKAEASFQGGDGYVYFKTPSLAYGVMTRIIQDVFTPLIPDECNDPFYDAHDSSLDFFLSLQDFNRRMMEAKDFGQLLFGFGPNLLYPTGSRQLKRQNEGAKAYSRIKAVHMRAIPQNAILMQLGWNATVLAGAGNAIGRDEEWFLSALSKSARLTQLFGLIAITLSRSKLDVLMAYIELYNPLFWLRLQATLPASERRAARHIARLLNKMDFYNSASHIVAILAQDGHRLQHFMNRILDPITDQERALNAQLAPILTQCQSLEEQQFSDDQHALRLALMMKLFLQIPLLPAFSTNPEARVEDVMTLCLHLDIDHATQILYRAFPMAESDGAKNEEDEIYDYSQARTKYIEPITKLYTEMRQISLNIAHLNKAIG